MGEKCIHGMNKAWCSVCSTAGENNKPKPPRSEGKEHSRSPARHGCRQGKMVERYQAQLRFMSGLTPQRRQLFDRMVLMGINEALMVRRYFGLDGQPPVSQKQVAREFGYKQATASIIINAVLLCLDPSQPGSRASRQRSESLARRMMELGIV